MNWETRSIANYPLRVAKAGTVVVGTGAAGYNAADRLYAYGYRDVAMVTEDVHAGTSRNTGSDKQTYYKLTLSGHERDSVYDMAQSLFAGKCMDGDLALVEAALSVPCFLRLCEAGVPFPVNRYGEYIGYKTDHDPKRRGTSVGPLTSRHMTEALEREVGIKGIPVLDGLLAVSILVEEGTVKGLLCLDLKAENRSQAYVALHCAHLVWATGGPAGMYADSVYPESQFGATGIAFEAGALGKNLTEWQYGLASLSPRWNVSGTYMQCLPRFYSVDADSVTRDFLQDFFTDTGDMLTKIFLKGYEWPFDVRKVEDGSSIIDILVYIECCLRQRRVFLDYTANPGGGSVDFSRLGEQARDYLTQAKATWGTPFQRLLHMNAPAVEFYRGRGVDLATQPLEIAVCAQHNNGGLDVDAWWQSSLSGLFVIGEAAGTHGVYRPGGSALNSGQVGSTRVARYIATRLRDMQPDEPGFLAACARQLEKHLACFDAVAAKGRDTIEGLIARAQQRMSLAGGPIRDLERICANLEETRLKMASFIKDVEVPNVRGMAHAYRYRDILISQLAYLGAMRDYIEYGGLSRGSAMYHDPIGQHPHSDLPDLFRYSLDDGGLDSMVQLTAYRDGQCVHTWRPVRPMPEENDFFENVWRAFRENSNVY